MARDVLPDLVIPPKGRRPDVMLRIDAVEVSLSQKLGVLGLQQQFIRGHGGMQRRPNVSLDHLRINVFLAAVPSDADPVISVLDEIDITNFVKLDRWELHVLVVSAVVVLPASGRKALPGKKLTVEIVEAIHAANDLRQRNSLQTAVALCLR